MGSEMCIRDRSGHLLPGLHRLGTPHVYQWHEPLDDGALHDYLHGCLLYTSDAADERSSVDLGGRRIIKKKTKSHITDSHTIQLTS